MTQPLDPTDDDSWREDPTGEGLPPHSTQPGEEVRILRIAGAETRPDIQILPDTHLTTDAMIAALSKDPAVYQRSGELVHVVRAPVEPKGRAPQAPGAPTIRATPVSWLGERVAARARCVIQKRSKDKGPTWLHVTPPKANVLAAKERGTWDDVRPLVGVTEAPVLRPDGTLCQEAGYDAATGYLYAPNAAFLEVEPKPSQAAARAALDTLLGVFGDFPYASPTHAIVPVAAVLTILARPAIDGAIPAFAFDAATRGSGKTLQCDVVSLIATGRTAARANYPEKDEELEKTLASYAMAGTRVILLDNVTRIVGGGALDAALTARDDVEFRILGKTEIHRLPWRALLMVSGNNLALGEDTTRRSLIARLESPLETPEERTDFRHPELIAWVKKWRPQLVHAALTILRSYTAAGAPDVGCARWGSFEEWSRLVPSALVHAGGADPMSMRATKAVAVNDAKRNLTVLVSGLARLSAQPIGARAIIDTLYPDRDPHDGPRAPDGYDDLREVIEDQTHTPAGRRPDANRLGRWLQKARGRVVGGKQLVRKDGHNHAHLWWVVGAPS